MSKPANTTWVILAFFAIYVIWGSTYLFNKMAVTELPPFLLAGIRFTTAGLLIFAISKGMGLPLDLNKKQLKNTFLAGFFFLTLGNGLAVWALKYLDSGFAALFIAAQPLVVMLMMWVVQGKKIRPMSLVGVVLGMIGIYLLTSQRELALQEGAGIGIALLVVCMLSWSYGSLFVAGAELPKNFFVNTAYQMITAGGSMLLISLVLGEKWSNPIHWLPQTHFALSMLIVFGSIVAFTSFNYLLKSVSPEKVATNTYVNPVIAMLLGWYFLHEEISTQSIIAAVVLLIGVYFINTAKKGISPLRFVRKR